MGIRMGVVRIFSCASNRKQDTVPVGLEVGQLNYGGASNILSSIKRRVMSQSSRLWPISPGPPAPFWRVLAY
jgi:hypothetical protein